MPKILSGRKGGVSIALASLFIGDLLAQQQG